MASSIKAGTRLNHTSANILKETFDAQTANKDHLTKEMLKEQYKPSTLGGNIIYSAIITEKIEPKDSDFSFSSMLNSLFTKENTENFVNYRIYIPEIHSSLGPPIILPEIKDLKTDADFKDYALKLTKMKSFPIVSPFFPDKPEVKDYKTGDTVWVMFQNSKTLENGFITGKVTQEVSSGTSYGQVAETRQSNSNQIAASNMPSPAISKTYFSKPDYNSPEESPERIVPGMDTTGKGRFLIDYSLLIDIMSTTKGQPYRYGDYPQAYSKDDRHSQMEFYVNYFRRMWNWNSAGLKKYIAIDPTRRQNHNYLYSTSKLEDTLYGTDCSGYIRHVLLHLSKCGIILNSLNGVSIIEQLSKNYYEQWINSFITHVKKGDQLPGDLCFHSKKHRGKKIINGKEEELVGHGHVTMVISYPLSEFDNHSYTWGSNGTGKCVDGQLPWNGVGIIGVTKSSKLTLEEREAKFARPTLATRYGFNAIKHNNLYYRIRPEWINPKYRETFQYNGYTAKTNGNKQANIDLYKKLIKDPTWAWNRQFAYNTDIHKHPPAVVSSPDKGYENARRSLEIMKKLESGVAPNQEDDLEMRVYFWHGNGEGPGPDMNGKSSSRGSD